jgi:hypothetical protein
MEYGNTSPPRPELSPTDVTEWAAPEDFDRPLLRVIDGLRDVDAEIKAHEKFLNRFARRPRLFHP